MKDDVIEFKKHLKKISGQGVDLYLEGKPASPDEIASVAKVKEEKAIEIYDFIKENF